MENSNSVEKIMGKKPQSDFNLQLIPNFISFDEAAKFVELIDKSDKIDSTIGVDGKVTKNNTRISQTVSLCDCDKIVIDLKRKVAKELDIPFNNIEPVQAQLYGVGGKFDLHQDGFDTNNLIKFGLASGNRVKTLMIYLNFDLEGGATTFPNVNESFMPFTGTAIRWDNLNDKGEPDIRAKHSGDEVKVGKKYILTFWARENKFDYEEDLRLYNEHMAEQRGLPPKYSSAEYHVIDTPNEVTNMLTTIMMAEKDNGKLETWAGDKFVPLRRQDIGEAYFLEGSVYISYIDTFMRLGTFCHENTGSYVVPKWQSFEIDDIWDFICVESVMKFRQNLEGEND